MPFKIVKNKTAKVSEELLQSVREYIDENYPPSPYYKNHFKRIREKEIL